MKDIIQREARDREREFLVALCRLGDPVAAAAEAGFSDPKTAARYLMGSPRVRQALAAAERSQLSNIALAANRITQRWLERVEQWMDTVDDPSKVPMKEVLRAQKIASEGRAKLEEQERNRALARASVQALEAIAERLGIDMKDITGRTLIDGAAEEL